MSECVERHLDAQNHIQADLDAAEDAQSAASGLGPAYSPSFRASVGAQ